MEAGARVEPTETIVVDKVILKAIELPQRSKEILSIEANRIHLQVNVNVLTNLIAMKITKTY